MKRFINLAILVAGIAFVSHFFDAAMARVDSMQQSVQKLSSR